MRKNRTKHEAKKPRLAKRALALCFALIFVCSCLLPVFAHSEEGLLEPSVSSKQSVDDPTEGGEDPVLLTEGGEDSNEEPKNEEPKPVEPEQKPAEPEQKPEEPKVEEQPKTEGTTGESKDSTEEQPKNEGATEETKPEGTTESKDSTEEQPKNEGTTEETKTEETKPEEPKQPTTNTTGDAINQGEATYTYRFWPDKIDTFDLEAINADVKSGTSLNDAAQSRARMVPCTVLTVMTNANLRDYQANVQQPTKSGYEFAGWYTVEGTTEDEFSFEQSLNFEESQTIDVFAKWNELKAVKSDALSNDGMTVEAKVGPMDNVESVTLAVPSQDDAETLRNSIDEKLYDQSYMAAILDITPKDKDGMAVEPQNGESVNVEISGLGFSAGDEGSVWVYHLTKSGRVETLYATVTSDGDVSFATKHFSPFAVVKLTESMVSFGTGDDRVATADLNENHTMTVGKTKTLHGSGALLLGTHSWKNENNDNDNTDAVTVRENRSSATVEAINAGTAIVTHNYDGVALHYVDRFNITVNEVESSYPLYVYVKMDPEVQKKLEGAGKDKLTINKDGWFTLGKVDSVQGLSDPKTYNGGESSNPKLQGKYSMYRSAVASLGGIERWSKNEQVNLDDVKWDNEDVNGEQFGLTTAKGATDYPETYDYHRTWHLDGYIKSLSAVVVNYYIDDGNDVKPTSIRTSETHLGSPGRTYQLTTGENGEKKDRIYYEGRWYKLTRIIPETEKAEFPTSGGVAYINLYYGLEPSEDTMTTPDTPYINVVKRFTGITKEQIPDNFEIHIGSHTLVKSAAEITTETDGTVVLRWKLDGVDVGTYDITEDGTDVPGYKLDSEKVTGTGTKVTVAAKEYNITYADRITSCKNTKLTVTVKQNDNESKFIVISATANTNIILSEYPFSASQRASVAKYLRDSAQGVFKNNTANEFYSIKESTSFTIAGANVTYDKAAGVVSIAATNQWNQVLKLSCATDKGENPEVKIVNPYTPATTSLTVTKTVEVGNAAAPANATFKFKLTVGSEEQYYKGVTFGDGVTATKEPGHENVWTFTLQAGHSATISGIRLNDTNVKVEEVEVDSKHYSTKYSVNDGTETPGTEATFSTLKQNSNTVVFTNTYSVPNLKSMTIHKKVTGAFGERTKDFTFKVELSNTTNPTLVNDVTASGAVTSKDKLNSFTMRHGDSVTLGNIPIDTTITITETGANDYKTSATGYSESVTGSNKRTFTYKVEERNGVATLVSTDTGAAKVAGNAIIVTNNFDGTPDTGVLLDTLPYLILLAVAVAGGVLVVVRKRKHRDE